VVGCLWSFPPTRFEPWYCRTQKKKISPCLLACGYGVFPCSPAWVVVCAGESSVWPNWHGSGLGGFLGRDHTVPSCCNALGVVLHPLVECFYVYIALTDSELLLTVARIGTEKKQLFKPYVVATNTFLISKNCLVPWTSAL